MEVLEQESTSVILGCEKNWELIIVSSTAMVSRQWKVQEKFLHDYERVRSKIEQLQWIEWWRRILKPPYLMLQVVELLELAKKSLSEENLELSTQWSPLFEY